MCIHGDSSRGVGNASTLVGGHHCQCQQSTDRQCGRPSATLRLRPSSTCRRRAAKARRAVLLGGKANIEWADLVCRASALPQSRQSGRARDGPSRPRQDARDRQLYGDSSGLTFRVRHPGARCRAPALQRLSPRRARRLRLQAAIVRQRGWCASVQNARGSRRRRSPLADSVLD